MTFLKTKYYPVNCITKTIVNDPQKRERDCSLPSKTYRGKGTIGIMGGRLNKFPCYREYKVVDSL